MTLVNTETGEIIEYDAAAAERRAERITLRLDAIAENYRMVLPMIREAIEKRDDIALGYRSPGEYVSDRFGQSLAGLGIEVRRAVVGELTEAGMSTRAIAPVVDADHSTVVRDLRRGASAPPADTPKPGIVNDDEPSPLSDHASGPVKLTGPNSASDPGEQRTTGIDGKSYPKSQPAPKPRRRPLPDQVRSAGWELTKAVERIQRLADDDRFDANKEQVTPKLRGHLSNAVDVCQDLIDRINQ